MRRAVLLIGAFGFFAGSALAQTAPPTDEELYQAGGRDYLLESAVRDAVFKADPLRANLQRIGLIETCKLADTAVKGGLADQNASFRALLLKTMREQIPPERFAMPGWRSFEGTVLLPYKTRVKDALRRDGASIYDRATEIALARFVVDADRQPAIVGKQWDDIFVDWDLSRGLALQIACSQYTLADPKVGKRIFDGFYQRKETP